MDSNLRGQPQPSSPGRQISHRARAGDSDPRAPVLLQRYQLRSRSAPPSRSTQERSRVRIGASSSTINTRVIGPSPLTRPQPDCQPQLSAHPPARTATSVTEKPGTSDTSIVRMGAPLDRAASDTPAFSTVISPFPVEVQRQTVCAHVRGCAPHTCPHAHACLAGRQLRSRPRNRPRIDRCDRASGFRSRPSAAVITRSSSMRVAWTGGAPEQCPVTQHVDQTRDAA